MIPLITENNAVIYICGNTKMGLEVQGLLKEWLGGAEGLRALEKEKRVVKELWST